MLPTKTPADGSNGLMIVLSDFDTFKPENHTLYLTDNCKFK